MNSERPPDSQTISVLSNPNSLIRTFLGRFLVVALIIAVVLLLSVLWLVRANSQQSVEDRLQAINSLQGASIERWMTELKTQISTESSINLASLTFYELPRRTDNVDRVRRNFRREILTVRGNASSFNTLSLLNLDGEVLASTDNQTVGNSYADAAFFDEALAHVLNSTAEDWSVYGSPLQIDLLNNSESLYLVSPVYSEHGEDQDILAGMMLGEANLETLQTILEEINLLGSQTQAYLVVDEEIIVTANLGIEIVNRADVGFPPSQNQNVTLHSDYVNFREQSSVGASQWLPSLRATFVVEQSQTAAFALFQTNAVFIGLVILLTVVIGILLIIFAIRRIINPISYLTDAAVSVAQGNLDQHIHLPRKDEIGVLAQALNQLTAELRHSINTLEERVNRRTRAMHASSEVGRRLIQILDLETLLYQVADLIKETFSYDSVQVLLKDEADELVIRASSGEVNFSLLPTELDDVYPTDSDRLIQEAAQGQMQLQNELHPASRLYAQGVRAQIALPLRRAKNVQGVLAVLSRKRNAFAEEDVDILQTVADQIAVAVRNATLYQRSEQAREQTQALVQDLQSLSADLSRRSTQLRTANEVAKAASTILDSQELVNEVVNRIKRHFEIYYVGLFLLDNFQSEATVKPEPRWAVLKAGTGPEGKKQLARQHRLPLDESSMVGWAIIHKKARTAGNVNTETIHYKNTDLPKTRSEIALPLISRGEVLGGVTIQSAEMNAFTTEDIDTLQSMADQIATALQNAALYSQAQAVQARFMDLYNRAPNGYHTLNAKGRLLEINDTGLKMLGRLDQRDELLNQANLRDFLEPESQSIFDDALRRLNQGDYVPNLELVYTRPDGSTLPVRMISAAHETASGGREIYSAVLDISLQKEAEAEQEALLSEMSILYQLGQSLLEVESQAEIYAATLNALHTVSVTAGVGIYLHRRTPLVFKLELVASWQPPNSADTMWPTASLGEQIEVSEELLQTWLVSGETLVVSTLEDWDKLSATGQAFFKTLGLRKFISVPVLSRSSVVGLVLINQDPQQPLKTTDSRNLPFIEGIVRQMSISIDNHTLLQEARLQADQLEAAAEVAKATTSEVELTRLLPQTAELIRDAFDYYHVAIFIVDDYSQYAILRAGTGEVGRTLLEENYRLPLSEKNDSLVGNAINEGKVKLSIDVRTDTTYTQHRLLPDTHSEVSLPLIVRGEVIGALDVQSNRWEAFRQSEVIVLQTMADQLSNAIYVARLFEQQAQAAQEVQALHQSYLREEWQNYLKHRTPNLTLSTSFSRNADSPSEAKQKVLQAALDENSQAKLTSLPDTADQKALLAPLSLRGEIIGGVGLMAEDGKAWAEEDLAIIEAVSAQAALAIENARLIEETGRRASQLQTSAEISQRVTALLDVSSLINNSIALIQSRFDFARVHLTLLENHGRATLYQGLPSNEPGEAMIETRRVKLDDHLMLQYVVQKQETLVLPHQQPHLFEPILQTYPDTASALVIPLKVFQNLSGLLEIHSLYPQAFGENQITVLEILATQIAISIQNARAYEEQQEINEKLRQVDHLKTQFLANMSHELRTPLNSIIGFSRVILKGIDGPLTDLQKTDLTSIYNSGQHLLGLINDILDLAKIEAGKLDLNFEPLDLAQILQSTLSTTVGLVKDKPITLEEKIPASLPSIVGDETRIRQIFINLLSNAAKFTEKGKITLTARHTARHVIVSVTDTGIGMTPAETEEIFQEFTQVDASTTRRAGGTGLGLPITKRFVELHHGRISVESRPRRGSTFTVFLPLTQPDENAAEQTQNAGQNRNKQVLVIDKDANVVDLYRRYLRQRNFEVLSLAPEAIPNLAAEVRRLNPFAVLIDPFNLPQSDGWALLGTLKADTATAQVPVVVCSLVDQRAEAEKLSVAAYLLKPVLAQDLLQTLGNLEVSEDE